MKKLITFVICVCLGVAVTQARTTTSPNVNDLPSAARSRLSTYNGKVGVHHIKIEHKFIGGNEYDVILNDGTEIEFNSDGQLTEIDCGSKAVPSKLILPAITKYVKANYPSAKIVQMEVERNSYKIELNNGLELKFSRSGKFLKVDD